MAKVIVLGGQKGGTGKSMISRHLAIKLVLDKQRVLVVDTDDQATAGFFTKKRKETHPDLPCYEYTKVLSYTELENIQGIKDQFDYIIIDVAGRKDNSLVVAFMLADVILVPFDPSPDSINTIPAITEILNSVKAEANPNVKVLSVVSKGLSKKINHMTKQAIKSAGVFDLVDIVVQNRTTFLYAISEGLTVFEYKPNDWKANREMNNLVKVILKNTSK